MPFLGDMLVPSRVHLTKNGVQIMFFLIIWPLGKPQWILVQGYQLGKVGFFCLLFFKKKLMVNGRCGLLVVRSEKKNIFELPPTSKVSNSI